MYRAWTFSIASSFVYFCAEHYQKQLIVWSGAWARPYVYYIHIRFPHPCPLFQTTPNSIFKSDIWWFLPYLVRSHTKLVKNSFSMTFPPPVFLLIRVRTQVDGCGYADMDRCSLPYASEWFPSNKQTQVHGQVYWYRNKVCCLPKSVPHVKWQHFFGNLIKIYVTYKLDSLLVNLFFINGQ